MFLFVWPGYFVCIFLRNWEAGVYFKLFLIATGFANLIFIKGSVCCLEGGCSTDPCHAILFQSWGLKLTLLNRWAAAVVAAPQTLRAPQEAMMTAPAAEVRTMALHLLRSLHTSSRTTTGRPLPMEPAGHKEATSSWTRSVSVLSLFWLREGRHVRPEVHLLFLWEKNL